MRRPSGSKPCWISEANPRPACESASTTKGCSGLSYTLEYADEVGKFEDVVEDKGVRLVIDPKATMFILGTEMDYVEEKMQAGFTFTNPNEKGRCGCGESFHV